LEVEGRGCDAKGSSESSSSASFGTELVSASEVSGLKLGKRLRIEAALNLAPSLFPLFALPFPANGFVDFLTPLEFLLVEVMPFALLVEPFGRPFAFGAEGVDVEGRGGLKGFGGIFAASLLFSLSIFSCLSCSGSSKSAATVFSVSISPLRLVPSAHPFLLRSSRCLFRPRELVEREVSCRGKGESILYVGWRWSVERGCGAGDN